MATKQQNKIATDRARRLAHMIFVADMPRLSEVGVRGVLLYQKQGKFT